VDNRLAGIVAPSDDCGVVAKEFVAAGSALSAQSDAVQKHQAAVEGLYAVQQSNLDIVRAYTNRVSFYKLVLQGAQEGAADKVRSLSESAGKALAGADARLEALLARAESRITKGAVKFDTELDGAAHALQADLTSKIDRSRSSVRELLTGLTHTASTTQP
jgi:hypothetical protein